MPLSYSGSYTGGGTTGTLATSGNYTDPPVPRQSQAQGIQGAENRAYTRQVTNNELVSNQLNNLMNQEGAYLSNARRRGLEQANRRGMLNSSIAAGSAERAGIEAAMPIASADAAAYGTAQTQNMEALNQNLMQQRDIMNQQEMARWNSVTAGQSAGMQAAIAREQMALDSQMQRERLAYEGEQAGLGRYHQLGMSNTEYGQQLGAMGMQYGLQNQNAAAQDQRTFGYGVQSAALAQMMQTQAQWDLNAMNNFWDDPASINPQDIELFSNIGQAFTGSSMNWLSSLFNGGG